VDLALLGGEPLGQEVGRGAVNNGRLNLLERAGEGQVLEKGPVQQRADLETPAPVPAGILTYLPAATLAAAADAFLVRYAASALM